MPRDVSTRWNSTFDMLHFAIEFRPAIDTMTAMRNLDLQKYELSPEEWHIAKELRGVLKVSLSNLFSVITKCFPGDFQGHDALFLLWNPQSRNCHPGHGPHRQYPGHQVQFFSVFSSYPSCSGYRQEHHQ